MKKAVIVALFFLFATLAVVLPLCAQERVPGPLYVVSFSAVVLLDEGPVAVEAPVKGAILPIPVDMVKDGWLCILSKRMHNPNGDQLQSIVCKRGTGAEEVTVGATAICVTHHTDIDIQRVTVGNAKQAIGIMLKCESHQAMGS